MSQCYDFQKWIMISLSSIAISLTIGLVSLVHGQETELQPLQPDSSQQTITTNNDSAIRGGVFFREQTYVLNTILSILYGIMRQ